MYIWYIRTCRGHNPLLFNNTVWDSQTQGQIYINITDTCSQKCLLSLLSWALSFFLIKTYNIKKSRKKMCPFFPPVLHGEVQGRTFNNLQIFCIFFFFLLSQPPPSFALYFGSQWCTETEISEDRFSNTAHPSEWAAADQRFPNHPLMPTAVHPWQAWTKCAHCAGSTSQS